MLLQASSTDVFTRSTSSLSTRAASGRAARAARDNLDLEPGVLRVTHTLQRVEGSAGSSLPRPGAPGDYPAFGPASRLCGLIGWRRERSGWRRPTVGRRVHGVRDHGRDPDRARRPKSQLVRRAQRCRANRRHGSMTCGTPARACSCRGSASSRRSADRRAQCD